jgi:hypothetical protein
MGRHRTSSRSPGRRAAAHVGIRVVDTLIAAAVSALLAWALDRISRARRSVPDVQGGRL